MDRQSESSSTPCRYNSGGTSPRTIRGRDQQFQFENSNVNNSNSKQTMSRDNLNNNNISLTSRRAELDSLSQSINIGPRQNYRSESEQNFNTNIITLANNCIEFDKNLRDADRVNISGTSSSSSNNSSFHDALAPETDLTQVNVALESIQLETKSVEVAESSPNVEVESQEIVTTTTSTSTPETDSSPVFGCPKQNQVFQTLKGIQDLRKDLSYTDITVHVGGEDFRCHKLVLANSSPFFKDLLAESKEKSEVNNDSDKHDSSINANMEENLNSSNNNSNRFDPEMGQDFNGNGLVKPLLYEDKTTEVKDTSANYDQSTNKISIEKLKPGTFEKVLDFAYCVFDDVITPDNVLDLLIAADRLQMNLLSQTCASYIAHTLSPSNVFEVIRLYDSGCSGLMDQRVLWRSHQVLCEHFLDLSATDEFLSLDSQHVRGLMEDSMLHVAAEVQVLDSLLRWVNFRPERRTSDMTLMLQHIRFPLMTSQELDRVLESPILKENKLANALVQESRFYSPLDYAGKLNWPRQNCISRRLFPTRDFILWTADRDKGLHFYSVVDGAHHKVTSFTNSRLATAGTPLVFDSTASVCCYENKIYFSGGEFMTDKLWSVDSVTGQVTVLAQMPRGRKYHSMVATRGCIYCLGGQDKRGYTVLDDVDGYIISKDTWVKAGKLAEPAYNMAAVVSDRSSLRSGGAIYLLGGEDHSGKPLRLIQCFEWLPPRLYSAFKVEVTGMPPSLFSARAVTSGLESLVYVVCGDGEVYKFETDKRSISHVTTIKQLSDNPRQRFGLAHVGGRIIVLGGHQLGHQPQEPIKSICLDLATKAEVRDFAPLLPGDNVNNCLAAKLSTNTLNLFI